MNDRTSDLVHKTIEISLQPGNADGTRTIATLEGVARRYGAKIENVATSPSQVIIDITCPTYYGIQVCIATAQEHGDIRLIENPEEVHGGSPKPSRSGMSREFASNKEAA